MILIDASVWIDHMRRAEPRLQRLMTDRQLLMHPYAIGEIMLGSIANRATVLTTLMDLPQAPVATHDEVLDLIERERLHGLGIGYVDAHLLASARLGDATLWTRDKRLDLAADRLGVRAGIERRR